jgi:hypothetical protein
MTDTVERLRAENSVVLAFGQDLSDLLLAAADEIERLRLACTAMNTEVCQRLGKALGYPWFKDDQENFPGATEENGVCTGEHVAESIAAEAADWIGEVEAQRDEAVERGNDWCDQAKKARAERDRLRSGWLMSIQTENSCATTGQPCRVRCGCALEQEALAAARLAPKETGHE